MQLDHGQIAFPSVKAQLKCTYRQETGTRRTHRWSLPRTNYDQLRARVAIPRILIVMLCPTEFTTWLQQDDRSLSLSHAAYWVSLRGMPAIEAGTNSTTVRVPLNQPFTVEALLRMMDKTGRGELL